MTPGDYVASPGQAKYGVVLFRYLSGHVEILWEGHAVPYACLPTAAIAVPDDSIPGSIRLDLQRRLKALLEVAV